MLSAEKCEFCRNFIDFPSSHTYESKTLKKFSFWRLSYFDDFVPWSTTLSENESYLCSNAHLCINFVLVLDCMKNFNCLKKFEKVVNSVKMYKILTSWKKLKYWISSIFRLRSWKGFNKILNIFLLQWNTVDHWFITKSLHFRPA